MKLYLDLYTVYPLHIPIKNKSFLDLRSQEDIMAHIIRPIYYLTILKEQGTTFFDY